MYVTGIIVWEKFFPSSHFMIVSKKFIEKWKKNPELTQCVNLVWLCLWVTASYYTESITLTKNAKSVDLDKSYIK